MVRGAIAVGACVVGLATGACGGGADSESAPEVEPAAAAIRAPLELDVENVATRLAAGEDIFLLDVRTPEELAQDGVIAGYTHIPINELESRLAEVPRDKPIVAY